MISPVTSTTAATAKSAATTSTTPVGGSLGKDAFLKLLVAQMQHQDPDKPMDGTQMSAQLAQFSSLEQLQQINAALASQQTGQAALMSAMNGGVAMNALGKEVTAQSDAVVVGATGSATGMEVGVAAGGGTATLHVYDANGLEVASRALGTLDAGRHTVDTEAATKGLAAGTYHVQVEVANAAGNPVDTATFVHGRVDRVAYTSNGPTFSIGGITVGMSNILDITN